MLNMVIKFQGHLSIHTAWNYSEASTPDLPGFSTELFNCSTPCQKQRGVPGTHKLAKSNLLLFIATFFSNNTDRLPAVHTAPHQGSGRLEGGMEETGGVHGEPKQQVASVNSIPQLINLVRVEGRES